MSPLTLALITAFAVAAAFTRRRRQQDRYRIHDAEQYAADLADPDKAASNKNDLVARQPAPFIPDEGPYIGGTMGYGRGGFGGRWNGLPHPDAARPPRND